MLTTYQYLLPLTFNFILNFSYTVVNFFWFRVIFESKVLILYYFRNLTIWGDGFLLDFLQKKTFDSFIRHYVIYTGFLFSERLIFESVIFLYYNLLIWPISKLLSFELLNTAAVLNFILFVFSLMSLIILLLFTVI